jgi:hypothetical protein
VINIQSVKNKKIIFFFKKCVKKKNKKLNIKKNKDRKKMVINRPSVK